MRCLQNRRRQLARTVQVLFSVWSDGGNERTTGAKRVKCDTEIDHKAIAYRVGKM
jgi:hypothetical protein